MSTWPIVGNLIRVGINVLRIGHLRALYLELNHRQHVFETNQIPTILAAISDVNHRLIASTADQDNLLRSAPIALRKIVREINSIRAELESTRVNQDRLGNRERDLAEVSNLLKFEITEAKGQIEQTKSELHKDTFEMKEAFAQLSNSINYLSGRVEFVRRELMYEMRYGASSPTSDSEKITTKTEIISFEKVADARSSKVRLNLGCGHVPIDGYLNVDRRPLTGVDIVAEVDKLPFDEEEVDEIFSAHLLEHFPQEQLRRELLPYFYKMLKVGGTFHAIVPDGQAMTIQAAKDPEYFESFRLVTYGAQDYDGDFHFNMFSPETLSSLLAEAGFSNIEIIARARRNDICLEFEIKSIK